MVVRKTKYQNQQKGEVLFANEHVARGLPEKVMFRYSLASHSLVKI